MSYVIYKKVLVSWLVYIEGKIFKYILKIYDVKENIVRFREISITCIYVYIYLKKNEGKARCIIKNERMFCV